MQGEMHSDHGMYPLSQFQKRYNSGFTREDQHGYGGLGHYDENTLFNPKPVYHDVHDEEEELDENMCLPGCCRISLGNLIICIVALLCFSGVALLYNVVSKRDYTTLGGIHETPWQRKHRLEKELKHANRRSTEAIRVTMQNLVRDFSAKDISYLTTNYYLDNFVFTDVDGSIHDATTFLNKIKSEAGMSLTHTELVDYNVINDQAWGYTRDTWTTQQGVETGSSNILKWTSKTNPPGSNHTRWYIASEMVLSVY